MKMRVISNVNWTSPIGANIKVSITIEKKIADKVINVDGQIFNKGKETYQFKRINVSANGKISDISYENPRITTNPEYIKKGAYASLGKVFFNKEKYDMIMEAIAKAESEAEEDDYTELKAIEIEKANEVKKIAYKKAQEFMAGNKNAVKNGLCPKCDTYCYGDCGK